MIKLRQQLQKALELDINHRPLLVLMELEENGTSTPSKLAKVALCSSAAMTLILDKLERRGLVSKRHCTVDRRVLLTEITEDGANMVIDVIKPEKELDKLGTIWQVVRGIRCEQK